MARRAALGFGKGEDVAHGVRVSVQERERAGLIALRGRASGSPSLAWFFALAVLDFNPTGPDVPRPVVLAFAVSSSGFFFAAMWFAIDFATRFAGDPNAVWVRRFRSTAVTYLAIAVVGKFHDTLSVYFTPSTPLFAGIVLDAAFAIAALGFFAALALAYANAPIGERRRVISVALSLVVDIAGFVGAVVCSNVDGARSYVAYPLVLVLAMPIGSAYAILRHRLLDRGFVVDRATVFGATSLVVLAALALVDFGLQALLGSWIVRSGLYVRLALALGIGMATRPIHARVDRLVDDVFFRERHEAERTLRAFARDVAFIDDGDVVVRRTIETVARTSGARCALYMLGADGHACVSRTSAAEPISRNDAAIVRPRGRRRLSHVRARPARRPHRMRGPCRRTGRLRARGTGSARRRRARRRSRDGRTSHRRARTRRRAPATGEPDR